MLHSVLLNVALNQWETHELDAVHQCWGTGEWRAHQNGSEDTAATAPTPTAHRPSSWSLPCSKLICLHPHLASVATRCCVVVSYLAKQRANGNKSGVCGLIDVEPNYLWEELKRRIKRVSHFTAKRQHVSTATSSGSVWETMKDSSLPLFLEFRARSHSFPLLDLWSFNPPSSHENILVAVQSLHTVEGDN